jgi:ABC-2 type transport system ATP-binding protein
MLQLINISAGYGPNIVIKDVNLICNTGEIHGILGWNGAGKTTLFNTIFGFLALKSGKILINNEKSGKDKISYLETDNYFYPYLRGREYLQLLGGEHNLMIQQWANIFDLPLDAPVDTYSTGMCKKLAIAGIILQDRPVLLLDEPFNGIDLESSEKLLFILDKLKNAGKTILLSSHILPSLTSVCSKISLLQGGSFQKTFSPEQFDKLETILKADIEDKMAGLEF